MISEESISESLLGFRQGDNAQLELLWRRYAERLHRMAESRLRGTAVRCASGEDVVQSVFRSICRGAVAGRFSSVANQDEIWWLLLAMTKRKVADYLRREIAAKRGAGSVAAETDLSPSADGARILDELIADEPDSAMLTELDENFERVMTRLRDDQMRRIAMARIEGQSVDEIAAQEQISPRSVDRKLQLIRSHWAREFLDGSALA